MLASVAVSLVASTYWWCRNRSAESGRSEREWKREWKE
jgi:hypothetical protein